MEKSCLPSSNFFPYKPSYHLRYLNLYATDLNLAVLVPGLKFKGG